MCGIHGVLSLKAGGVLPSGLLQRMGDVTIHRGPDDSGGYEADGVAIGMRRLSIIDLEGGHQPISNEDQSLWMVCNGEIYNFRELRQRLQEQGHSFKTGSDSEVILHLYEEHGDDFVQHLSGMFGFALWDVRRQRLLVGRDRLGIKPLYYMNDGQRLAFASEAKSILALPGVEARLSPQGLDQYLALGYVPTPYTLFDGISKLPPGHMLICEKGRVEIRPFWRFSIEPDHSRTESQWADEVLECFDRAVTAQMVSDVPLGAFLSGGIDSSSVVALMAKHSNAPIKTYSIGFDTGKAGEFYNELPYARQVSELFQTEHKEILVKPDVVELLPKLLWHMDEPMADAAFITTYLVSEFARRDVTVILSGVGGDELFGGYRRYLGEYYGSHYNRLPGWLRQKVLLPMAKRLPSDRHSPLMNLSRYARSFILSASLPFRDRYRSYVQVFSDEAREALMNSDRRGVNDALEQAFDQAAASQGVDQLFHVDMLTQLPDDLLMLTDKMSMATSIECRVPLLDDKLLELAARMPARYKIHGRELKYILKKALSGLLPDEILYRKKRGFGAPMGAWLKQELAPLMKQVLSRESVQERGLFAWDKIEETMKLHESNREDHTDHLLSLMNLELWCRLYIDGRTPAELSDQFKTGMAA